MSNTRTLQSISRRIITSGLSYTLVPLKKTYTTPNLSRRQNIAIVRVRIGQTFFTHYFLIITYLLLLSY